MHGDRLGIAQSPTVAASYLIVAGVLMAASKFAVVEPVVREAGEHLPHGHAKPEPAVSGPPLGAETSSPG
jgi:AGZA family xanthine/uracil permease-like MFS transporter